MLVPLVYRRKVGTLYTGTGRSFNVTNSIMYVSRNWNLAEAIAPQRKNASDLNLSYRLAD